MNKHLVWIGLILLCGSASFAASTDTVKPMSATGAAVIPPTLERYLLQVRDKNPELLAARERSRAAFRLVAPAGVWPDPTVTYMDEETPSSMEPDGKEKMQRYRFEQQIPFPGKRTAERTMKVHEALTAEARYRVTAVEIMSQVRMRFYQLYLTDEKLALAKQAADVMRSALKTAQARLGSNQISASDVFMAQTELRRLENSVYQQQQERSMIAIELNTLLNQPSETALDEAAAPTLEPLPLTLEEFQRLAKQSAPQYRLARHEIDHSRAMLRRDRLAFAPDFGGMYEHLEGEGGRTGRTIGASLSFPLWFRRPWAEYQAAKVHVAESERVAEMMSNEVRSTVHKEFIQVTTHLHLAKNYQTSLLPLALSNLRITQQQYAGGKGDFLRLLEAFRTWISTHNEYQEELYQYAEHAAVLGRWVGVDIAWAKQALDQEKWQLPGEQHE